MPLIENPTSDVLKRVTSFHNVRQATIASNIANANTPGYRAFDLILSDRVNAGRLEPKRTNPRHMARFKKTATRNQSFAISMTFCIARPIVADTLNYSDRTSPAFHSSATGNGSPN